MAFEKRECRIRTTSESVHASWRLRTAGVGCAWRRSARSAHTYAKAPMHARPGPNPTRPPNRGLPGIEPKQPNVAKTTASSAGLGRQYEAELNLTQGNLPPETVGAKGVSGEPAAPSGPEPTSAQQLTAEPPKQLGAAEAPSAEVPFDCLPYPAYAIRMAFEKRANAESEQPANQFMLHGGSELLGRWLRRCAWPRSARSA
eukprot:COSAG06_NODE_24639_length_657_cov_0.741935_1_plen_200_part_10